MSTPNVFLDMHNSYLTLNTTSWYYNECEDGGQQNPVAGYQ